MVVERSQINRRECASFKAGGHVFVTEQVLERVGFALGLDQFLLAVENGRLRKHAVYRRYNFGISNRAHSRLEPADKKFTDVCVMFERIFRLFHIQLVVGGKLIACHLRKHRHAKTGKGSEYTAYRVLRQQLHKDIKCGIHETKDSNSAWHAAATGTFSYFFVKKALLCSENIDKCPFVHYICV